MTETDKQWSSLYLIEAVSEDKLAWIKQMMTCSPCEGCHKVKSELTQRASLSRGAFMIDSRSKEAYGLSV